MDDGTINNHYEPVCSLALAFSLIWMLMRPLSVQSKTLPPMRPVSAKAVAAAAAVVVLLPSKWTHELDQWPAVTVSASSSSSSSHSPNLRRALCSHSLSPFVCWFYARAYTMLICSKLPHLAPLPLPTDDWWSINFHRSSHLQWRWWGEVKENKEDSDRPSQKAHNLCLYACLCVWQFYT